MFSAHTPDALEELSMKLKYNERTQVFEDLHARLHELSPLEGEFTDLYKSCLNHKTINNKARRTVRKPWFDSQCRQAKLQQALASNNTNNAFKRDWHTRKKYKQVRLHELSPLEAVREFTDFYKSCLNHKTINNKARRYVRKLYMVCRYSQCRQAKHELQALASNNPNNAFKREQYWHTR